MDKLDEYIEHYEMLSTEYERSKSLTEQFAQLANWLKELKAYRDFKDVLYKSCDEWCKFPEYKESGTMCGACEIGGIKDLLEIALEEVKADDNISED